MSQSGRVKKLWPVLPCLLVSEILHVSQVAHPDYPAYQRLRTVSKVELLSHFCETPSIWGERQNTLYSGFAKSPRFLNMVITFVLTPLSHYNSITEPRAWFLLSLLEDLSIDFPFHFIISIIDVYWDTTTRIKLIFPSAITRILRHFSIPILDSLLYTVMGAINVMSVGRSEAQLRSKWPQTKMMDPPAPTIPSTSNHSSSTGGVTLKAIMAQLQRMDAHLDTLTTKLYQVNPHVGRIRITLVALLLLHLLLQRLLGMRMLLMVMIMMRMRMRMSALSVMMRQPLSDPLSFMTKRVSRFWMMRVVMYLRGELA